MGIFEQGHGVTKKVDQGHQGTTPKHKVSACWAVACNVAQGPHSLLPNIRLGAVEQLDEDGDGARVDDDLCLLGGSGSNVGESPGSLKLDQGVGRTEEFDEAADNASVDDSFDGRVALLR